MGRVTAIVDAVQQQLLTSEPMSISAVLHVSEVRSHLSIWQNAEVLACVWSINKGPWLALSLTLHFLTSGYIPKS